MELPYPKMANYLIIKKQGNRSYLIKNCLTEKTFRMDAKDFFFLRYLNGMRNPYDYNKNIFSKKEIEANLRKFAKCRLIRTDTRLDPGMNTVYIPTHFQKKTAFAVFFNTLITITFLPIFLYALWNLQNYIGAINTNSFLISGWAFGLIAASFVHEVGHALACLSFGGRFFEFGIITNFIPGFYAMIDTSNVNSQRKRVHVLMAGIEMNLLFTGLTFFIATKISLLSGLFFWVGAANLIYAVIHMTTMKNMDGKAVMQELFGIDSDTLTGFASGKVQNLYWKSDRINGIFVSITAISVRISKYIIPMLILAEILTILR